MKFRDNHYLPLMALVLLAGAGSQTGMAQSRMTGRSGPAADFPMTVGAPYSIGSTSYTPADTMNYDAVGYAAVADDGDTTISAAHHTLPVPSYIEVTALDTGRTILVRVAHRGPMDSNSVVALSSGAAAQLGVGDHAAVRVRRVNPPENERELLRSGGTAPERMNTPKPLLSVLMRKLQPGAPVGLNPSSAVSVGQPAGGSMHPMMPSMTAPQVKAMPRRHSAPQQLMPAEQAATQAEMPPEAQPAMADMEPVTPMRPMPAAHTRGAVHAKSEHIATVKAPPRAEKTPMPAEPVEAGSWVIQVGAFADKSHAEALAAKIGGKISPSGHLWRVRTGPYASQRAADAGLAKVRAAGYSGARIQHAD